RLRAIAAKAKEVLNACSTITRAAFMGDMRTMLDDNHRLTATETRFRAEHPETAEGELERECWNQAGIIRKYIVDGSELSADAAFAAHALENAADELASLRAGLERLRAALEWRPI